MEFYKLLKCVGVRQVFIKLKAFVGFLFKEWLSQYDVGVILQSWEALLSLLERRFTPQLERYPRVFLYVRYAREEHRLVGGVRNVPPKSLCNYYGLFHCLGDATRLHEYQSESTVGPVRPC
jgi:hypothetical protein